MPQLISIQIAKPQTFEPAPDFPLASKPWTTGIYKESVEGLVLAESLGLEGDGQADDDHGGVDKAVCVYSADHFPAWSTALANLTSTDADAVGGDSPPNASLLRLLADGFPNGGFGENFTVTGLVETGVCIGDRWEIGEATFEVSQPRQPCWKLARRWNLRELALWVKENGKTGWYLRVVKSGKISAGDTMTLVERTEPDWTIARANDVMHGRDTTLRSTQSLFNLATLSDAWKEDLLPRLSE